MPIQNIKDTNKISFIHDKYDSYHYITTYSVNVKVLIGWSKYGNSSNKRPPSYQDLHVVSDFPKISKFY